MSMSSFWEVLELDSRCTAVDTSSMIPTNSTKPLWQDTGATMENMYWSTLRFSTISVYLSSCLAKCRSRSRWETDADSGEVVPRCVGSIQTVSFPPFRGQRAIRVFNAQCETVLWHREQTTRAPVNGPRQQFSLPPLATSGTSAPGSIMASAVHRVHAHMKASADGAGVA